MRIYPRIYDVKFSVPFTKTKVAEIKQSSYLNAGVIYDQEILDHVVQNYRTFNSRKDYRMHNLYNTTRYWPDDVGKELLKSFSRKLGFARSNAWLLEYKKESYANLHRDPSNAVTFVTLLSKPEECVGGQNLIIVNHERGAPAKEKVVYPETALNRNNETYWYNGIDGGIPRIVEMKQNETVIYAGQTTHGVTELIEGRRLVMVHWMYFE